MATDTKQENLKRLLGELQSNDLECCLSALQELCSLDYTNQAILRELERLALHGGDENIRQGARETLGNRVHQNERARFNTLDRYDRQLLLKHIELWESDGLLQRDTADVIKQRYSFDTPQPVVPPKPAPVVETEPRPAPQTRPSALPAAPRPSLTQTLLSESSIKIYLYLGAFFVIASALILAALVEAARLPILTAATLIFGAGAVFLHKRLPQPSFALFIVFSFLLPIDANVLAETFVINGTALSIYWTIVFLVLTGIWAFSTWFYESKFFSAAAFISLCLAFYRVGTIFSSAVELQIFLGLLASLMGLAFTHVLKKWKGTHFAIFVFLLAQLLTACLLLLSLSLSGLQFFYGREISQGGWLIVVLTWLTAASFYILSDILFPFFLFPWMAAGALLPLPWFILAGFDLAQPAFALGCWIWGTVFAVASQVMLGQPSAGMKKNHWPLLAGSAGLFLVSFVIALFWESQTLPFTLFALAALVYTLLHLLRTRWYVWSAALLCALSAYFLFFELPIMKGFDVHEVYQFLIASVLLLVPELFMKTPLSANSQTRLPPILLGMTVSLFPMAALANPDQTGPTAVLLAVYATLFILYAVHTKLKWLGYFAATAGSLAIVYALYHFNLDLWLPVLTALSLLLYTAGFFLRRGTYEMKAWSNVLTICGLSLGALVSIASLGLSKETGGWYTILIASLFALEMFTRPLLWLELAVEVLLSMAVYQMLDDFQIAQIPHLLFGASLIWLGGDLLFQHFILKKRPGRLVTLGVGYTLAALCTLALWDMGNAALAAVYYFIYSLFFAYSAVSQRESRLGYLSTVFLPLTVLNLCTVLDYDRRIFPLILISFLYYASGYWLRRKGTVPGWAQMLLYSGLGLGVVTSCLAPLEGGLEASIPVAITATLFAVEAYARRNVWLAIPANALYLLSYFMLLRELDVNGPQYYSIGAALLGMLMHYLLTRAGSKTGSIIAGMLSQFVLLGTTYIQMVSTGKLYFFFILFIQALVVLIYGLIQRSRSLVVTPIVFAVVGVMTVIYSALKGLGPVILIGSTGLVLLTVGIIAVLMRERISKLGEQLSEWRP
jgi:hypothetical protein